MSGGIAPERNGARRWLNLPGLPEFHPSEVAKYAVVLWAAALAAKKGPKVREFKKGVLPFLVMFGIVCLLIMRQPNLSMTVVVGLLGGVVLFAAGARIGHFILLLFSAGLVGYQLSVTSEYRLRRWASFLGEGSSETAMQVNESVVALGSGQIVGLGFGQGRAKLAHVPYAYSDFIFSSIGEEWGLLGVLVVVLRFAVFGWIGYRIAKTAPDPFGQLLATGIRPGGRGRRGDGRDRGAARRSSGAA